MSDEGQTADKISARALAIAAIFRAVLWPSIALLIIYLFAGSARDLIKDIRAVNIAGFEIEKFEQVNTLTEQQLEALNSLTGQEILYFYSSFPHGGYQCKDVEFVSGRDRLLINAGLVEISTADCNGSPSVSVIQMTAEGSRLRFLIDQIVVESLSRYVLSEAE